jgi:DNA-binding winged helix-turn-helix (wHTH) protein
MPSSDMCYAFGPFQLDVRERTLRRGGADVPLTRKAFDVLAALVVRHGHVVAKAELMRLVWSDTIVDPSNLTQHVYVLRKTLGCADGVSVIETIPRRGYRVSVPVRECPRDDVDGRVAGPPRVERVRPPRMPLAATLAAVGGMMLCAVMLGRSLR